MPPAEPPAHPALRPQPLAYEAAAGEIAEAMQLALGATSVRRARTAHLPPFGYYRLVAEQSLFVKVVPRDRLPHLLAVQDVVQLLRQAGCPVQPMLGPPLDLADDAVGLVYAYIDERFAEDAVADAAQVGAALRSVHDALAQITPTGSTGRMADHWRSAIERLGEAPIPDGFTRSKAESLLSQWDAVAGILDQDKQLIHNDFHRGNVLMGADGVAAVLDFDDSISSVASPLVDLAIALERFCLAETSRGLSLKLARAFLRGYGRPISAISAGQLERIALARLLYSLSILYANPRPDDRNWRAEHDKFTMLIRRWPGWRLNLIEAGSAA